MVCEHMLLESEPRLALASFLNFVVIVGKTLIHRLLR